MKLKILLVGLVFGLLLPACTSIGSSSTDQLSGTEWQLLYIRKSTPLAGSTTTISFDDGAVSGNASCNSYSGSYEINGNMISFGPLVMTEMACMAPDGIMQQEQDYLAFLSEVVTFSIMEEQLLLKQEQQNQLTFVKKPDN